MKDTDKTKEQLISKLDELRKRIAELEVSESERKQAEDLMRFQRDLGMELSTAGGLDKALQRCLETAIRVSGMDCGGIYLVDEDSGNIDLIFHKGLTDDFINCVSHYDAGSDNARIIMAGKPVYTRYQKLDVPLNKTKRQENLRAIAVVPVRYEDRVIGCLNISSHIIDELPGFARDALETIAAQIGGAIARKKAEEALRESEEKYRSLVESTEDSIYLLDTDCTYMFMNKKHMSRLGLAGEKVIGRTYAEFHSEDDTKDFVGKVEKVLETGKSLYYEYKSQRDGGYFLRTLSSVKEPDGKITSVTVVSKNITERMRAEDELKTSREQLRNLSTYLQSAREQERTSLAREIHDELAQALTALKMDISWLGKRLPKDKKPLLDKTKAMKELTDMTIKMVKRISTELRPGLLDDLGLSAALEWKAEEFQNRSGIACKLTVDPEDIVMDEERSTAVFRIFQETLTNAARHAKATEIVGSLKEKEGTIELIARDNGKGITKKQISDPKSFGLMGIRERAISCGGNVKIKGVPGDGTTVIVSIPVEKISRKGAKNAK